MRTTPLARIVVLARAPVPGRCKTRLIPALGRPRAAALHRRLVLRTIATARASGAPVELWCAPDTRHPFFQRCRRELGVRLRRQPAGDLGKRMALALRSPGVPSVLVGTDCPGLSPADLREALRALGRRDAVLQPSCDGGYVLIGSAGRAPLALAGIPWSSGRELALTRRRFARRGLSWHELPPRADLDTPADLRRARRRDRL